MPPGLRTPASVSPGLIDYEQEGNVQPAADALTVDGRAWCCGGQ